MPPKKNNNKKTKSKRYSCELCTGIDNTLMIQCNNCDAKYHLKCLNIKSRGESEKWICSECKKLDLSGRKTSSGKSGQSPPQQSGDLYPQSKTQANARANESRSKSSESDTETQTNGRDSHKSNVNNDRNSESQSQGRSSQQMSRNSQATRSSIRKRTQIELNRLEEERQLKERRDKEYLDSKYRILLEDCSDKTERTGSERRSTDRSSFTRDWVQQQGAGTQPNASKAPRSAKSDDDRSAMENTRRFVKRINEITFENPSPRNQLEQLSAKDPAEPNPTSMPRERQAQSTMFSKVNPLFTRSAFNKERLQVNPLDTRSTFNREREPCYEHDARRFMFQDREMSSQNNNKAPCSNSTFVAPKTSNNNTTVNRERDQRSYMADPDSMNHNTLEWDNFVGTQEEPEKNLRVQSDRPQVRSKAIWENFNKWRSLNRDMNSTEFKGNQPSLKERNYGDETAYVSNEDHFQSTFKGHQPNFKERNYNDETIYEADDDQLTYDGRSASDQSHRKVTFDEPKTYKRDMSNDLSVGSQLKTNSASAVQVNEGITQNQLAARHVVDKKLPIFIGNPKEWQIWYHQYKNSTELCGFTDGENLDRLQKCLRGKARDVVRGRLTHPDSVPWIIETLEMLYGRPEIIIKTIINEIKDYAPLKPERLDELMDFAFEVQTICKTIESLNRVDHLHNPTLIEDLVDKLPTQEKKDWARHKSGLRTVTLKTLSDWLYSLARLLSTVTTPRATKSNERKPEKEKFERNEKTIGLERVNVHVNRNTNEVNNRQGNHQTGKSQQKKYPCLVCNNECNKVESCSKFKSLSIDERYKALKEHKLCRICLRRHTGSCRVASVCGKNGCQYKHHFLLHNDERHSPPKDDSIVTTTVAPSNFHAVINISTMLRIVPVVLYNGIKSVFTFAFLDEGTTATMMEKWLADELGLSGTSEQICLIWTKKIHRRERAERVSIEISGIGEFNKRYEMKGVRTVSDLHLPDQTINKSDLVAKYPYLRDIPLVDYKNVTPGIMIGSDMPKFGTQLQVVESEEVENDEFNGPMASKTRLGWSVHGPRNGSTTNEHVNVHQFEICPHHNELDNDIHQRVKEYFSIENFGVQANSKINLESKENERALQMLERLTKRKDGRYETGLLWKSEDVSLPNSYPMAMKRLSSLEKQGPDIMKKLGVKIADYVAKGYAKKLTEEELKYEGPVWYLPPFGVVHPKKPDKLRLVFEAAAKTKSVSLNSNLLKGPDMYTSLVDILRRFRERRYTGGGDILEMYHQVSMTEKDRHFQRFLFRDDINKEPDVYQLNVMTFGANCSPSSAQFVKNKNAADFKETHPRAVSAIIDNHYVDDMMDCEHTEEEMIQLMADVRMIHAKGGFKIRNFISNSENVLKALGENEANEVIDISPKTELNVKRVLGMWYNTKVDIFTFSLKYTPIDEEIFNKKKMPTKREILRTLMSIFDPLGLLSNFLIYLKILLQEVWRIQMDWDEQISSRNLVERWNRWLEILPDEEKVKVPRLYSPKLSPNKPRSIQMHVFVDASEDAFSAVVYFRIEDEDGADCTLVGSKARVAPLKYLSIPRKELQASVLGTRLAISINNAHRFRIDKRIIWTDSATVVSWLNSDHRKYSQFVAHRVGEILESSDVDEWRWIPTKENVADEATKWTKTPNFDPSNRWFSGPEFLRLSENQWPKKKPITIDVEEEMKAHFAHSSFLILQIVDPERFPTYKRMVRALAYAIRFFNLYNGKAKKGEPLSQDELRKAETLIFRQAQFEGYPSEMVTLERNKVLPVKKHKFIEKPSPLYDGTPYLDAEGVLRMKGRIDGARELSMDTKRPIVLPKNSQITKLLLLEYHSKFFHQNHETVVNEVRQRFYIPNLRAVLKKAKKSCQSCIIKKAHPIPPQMANLPECRLATRFVPFSFVGIDFFGPMYITVGRHTEKRWGVLFTCLTIRAIHIEIAPGLDTNSCILCIQNFVADHGPVIEFHSDCGTNFKGSDNVLQQEISKIDPERLQTEFTTTYTKWIFNPPASPHMGGAWERLIGLVKSGIDEIMPTRTPKEDMLRNLLKQIQNVVNSRPLTFIPLDFEDDEALTPNHFLKLSSNGSKPPCQIELDGPYLRESWKESQRLTEFFWKRFLKEYLPSLARRTKWHKPVEPLKQGDLVLIVDENSPRNTYPKAKIVKTYMGSNGQVRRAKVQVISSTKSNSAGQIIEVKKKELWRSAHKLALLDVTNKSCSQSNALLDVASNDGLADSSLNRETGGSVGATKFKSKVCAQASLTDLIDETRPLDHPMTSQTDCQIIQK